MSSLARMGTGFRLRERVVRRSVQSYPGQECWAVGEDPPDCHESGALSFVYLSHARYTVNVGVFQDSRFFVSKNRKERKK